MFLNIKKTLKKWNNSYLIYKTLSVMANQLAESWLGVPDILHPKKIFLFFCFILLGKVFIINITIFKLFDVYYLT